MSEVDVETQHGIVTSVITSRSIHDLDLKVGSEVIEAFTTRFANGEKLFTPTRPGHAFVDLLQANRDQLESAGVARERIHTAPICTMCRTDLFFSYRKEKSLHGKVGRLMAVVGRK